jgi:hypothetical protein
MIDLIDPKIESILQEVILSDLERGRANFDRPHTEAVVYWRKELLAKLNYSKSMNKVMITAAYAHDWGYVGLFEGVNSSDIALIHKMKPLHMQRGAEKIKQLIKENFDHNEYAKDETDMVMQLVSVHDNIEELQSDQEILIMEADTMGMLDADRVKPTFTKADNDIFIEREICGRRLPRFRHELAKDLVQGLVKKRVEFFN